MSEENEQVLDIDTLFQDEVINADQVNQTIRDSGAPAGTYTSNPEEYPLNAYPKEREEKNIDGTRTGVRRSIDIVGLFTLKETKTRIRFTISPDARKAKVYEGEEGNKKWTGEYLERPDNQSKLFAQAVKVYEAARKELPKGVPQLVEFLREEAFSVRTMVGRDGEPVVLNVLARRGR